MIHGEAQSAAAWQGVTVAAVLHSGGGEGPRVELAQVPGTLAACSTLAPQQPHPAGSYAEPVMEGCSVISCASTEHALVSRRSSSKCCYHLLLPASLYKFDSSLSLTTPSIIMSILITHYSLHHWIRS